MVELNQYKNLPAETRYPEGRALFKKFIEVGAPLELNLDPVERQELIDYYKVRARFVSFLLSFTDALML